jgi:hypothetical protein
MRREAGQTDGRKYNGVGAKSIESTFGSIAIWDADAAALAETTRKVKSDDVRIVCGPCGARLCWPALGFGSARSDPQDSRRTNGWMDGWMDGWLGGVMDVKTGGRTELY